MADTALPLLVATLPWVANSPFMSWVYEILSVTAFSTATAAIGLFPAPVNFLLITPASVRNPRAAFRFCSRPVNP